MTEKPRRFRRGKSEYDTEAPHTSPTGSEDLSEEGDTTPQVRLGGGRRKDDL